MFILLVSLFLVLPVFLLLICPSNSFYFFPLPFFVSSALIHFSKLMYLFLIPFSLSFVLSFFVTYLRPSFSSVRLFLVNVFGIYNFVHYRIPLYYLFVSLFAPFLFLLLSFIFHSFVVLVFPLILESNTRACKRQFCCFSCNSEHWYCQ